MKLVAKIARRLKAEWDRRVEASQLGPLYSPDPNDLDLDAHLSEALDWLRRAQDTGNDRGVSYGVRFGDGFDVSYPETTGYICRTFVEVSRLTGDADLFRRALEMALWEVAIQLPSGAVMGGKYNTNPSPAVFNTGMVLLGWNALVRATCDERLKSAMVRAADWLISVQEPNGNWVAGNSLFANAQTTVYNVKVAWGLCETGILLGREDYVLAAIRNAQFCMSRQEGNGWLKDCCLLDASKPLLHTLAYAMQGLLEIGKLTGKDEFILAAKKMADSELAILSKDGFLPGQQDCRFRRVVNWCCLTGSAQTSIVWAALYALTGQRKYHEAACLVNRYLMARHDIRNADIRLRGGVPGSWPVDGAYGRLQILNWATKYLVDALICEKYGVPSSGEWVEAR